MSRVLLVIPPDYEYNFPLLGTPALCGFLSSKGIDTLQFDLNIEYRNFLIRRIDCPNLNPIQKKIILPALMRKFFEKRLYQRYYSSILPRIKQKTIKDLPYANNTNSSFYFTERILEKKYLFRYLIDKDNNTFYQSYIEYDIINKLKDKRIDLLGISVTSPSQAIASLTLGLMVKNAIPNIHVTLGGQWVTLFHKQLKKRDNLFRCFDSLILFEGETPFYTLIRCIENRKKIDIPNVITYKNKNPAINSDGEIMNNIACPNFKNLNLKDYDMSSSKEINITYETSRGCYWNKCAYCVDLPQPKPKYRSKPAQIVANEITALIKKYNATNLMMGDPGMSPRQMLEISRTIIKRKIKIKWWTMARLDPGFNKSIFTSAKISGLDMINFGFESANDKVCELVHKGNKQELSSRIIKECHDSGIKVGLQTMLGLPNETYQYALDTIDFLVTNQQYIHDVTFNTFYLTPGNYVYFNPQKYGITFNNKKVLPFQFFIPFKNTNGLTQKQAKLMEHIYYKLIKQPLKKPKKIDTSKNKQKVSIQLCGEKITINTIPISKTELFIQ